MRTPVVFDEQVCNGCNLCVEVCPMDIFAPNPVRKRAPIVVYGDECRLCGACWVRCPLNARGAIKVVPPPAARVSILRGERP